MWRHNHPPFEPEVALALNYVRMSAVAYDQQVSFLTVKFLEVAYLIEKENIWRFIW